MVQHVEMAASSSTLGVPPPFSCARLVCVLEVVSYVPKRLAPHAVFGISSPSLLELLPRAVWQPVRASVSARTTLPRRVSRLESFRRAVAGPSLTDNSPNSLSISMLDSRPRLRAVGNRPLGVNISASDERCGGLGPR